MQRIILPVVISFFSVIFIITFGTNIAYRKKVIPNIETKLEEEANTKNEIIKEQDNYIEQLKKELKVTADEKIKIEGKLKEKLDKEERLRLEQQQIQADKLAADKKAAAEARLAAKKSATKKSSKKSKAS